jgi:hypothetical protein
MDDGPEPQPAATLTGTEREITAASPIIPQNGPARKVAEKTAA